jgi:hypothetical protein
MIRHPGMLLVGLLLPTAFLYGVFTMAAENSRPPPPLPPEIVSKYSPRLDKLDMEAAETAYKEQIQHLFSTWMLDATGQPERAVNGALKARRAFLGAMNEIETRQVLHQREQQQ